MADLSPRTTLPILLQSQTSLSSFDSQDQNIEKSPHICFSPDVFEISSPDSDSYADSDLDDIPFTQLLFKMQRTEEDIMLYSNGYRKLNKICDTLQGQLIKAEVTSSCKNVPTGSFVAIKKTEKVLQQQHMAVQDETNFYVSEDVVQEALILKKLTSNTNCNSHIVKYIDYFESETHLYLVMEYVDHAITLKKFVNQSHELINNNKLTLKQYAKTIRRIMWQLVNTIAYLHNTDSCHLDLVLENIMIQNWMCIESNNDNYLQPNPLINVKICDFGVAEIFDGEHDKTFLVHKHQLSLDNGCFIAPEIYKYSKYDGRSADIWSLGILFFHCMVGKPLFIASDMWEQPQSGYLALKNNALRQYLSVENLLKYFRGSSFYLLKKLLCMNPNKRFNAKQIVKHQWFSIYNKQIKN